MIRVRPGKVYMRVYAKFRFKVMFGRGYGSEIKRGCGPGCGCGSKSKKGCGCGCGCGSKL